jgi:hypothetical protein
LLRDRLGVEPYDDPIRNAKQLPITGEDIAQVKAELDTLPHRAPYPDFFGLGEAEQQVIVKAVGKEWETMVEVLREHNFPPLTNKQAAQSPLAYLSPRTLRHAIANNPTVNPVDLCRAFIEVPHRFYGRVEELLEATSLLELGRKTSSGSGADAFGEVRVLNGNRLDMVMLMRDPVVKPEIRSMELGDTVFLSKPAIGENKAEIIRPSQLSNIIEKNLAFLGRSLYDVLPSPKPEKAKLVRWGSVNVAEALACKFFGSMTDLAMTVLPVSQEELLRRLPQTKFDAEDMYEVIFTVNMHSSGRAPAPAMLQLMLAICKNVNSGSITKTTWRPRSTGIDVAAALLRKSAAVAARVQAYNMRRQYRAGSPGTGKSS